MCGNRERRPIVAHRVLHFCGGCVSNVGNKGVLVLQSDSFGRYNSACGFRST